MFYVISISTVWKLHAWYTVWVVTLPSAANGHLSECPSKKIQTLVYIFYPFAMPQITWLSSQLAKSLKQVTECHLHECLLALHWVHRQGTHPSTIPDWYIIPMYWFCFRNIFFHDIQVRELSFLPGRGSSICDRGSSVFPGPPKNLAPLLAYIKITGPLWPLLE